MDDDAPCFWTALIFQEKAIMTDIKIERATADFSDWDAVRGLNLDAFAYIDGRIDPPSSALSFTPAGWRENSAASQYRFSEPWAPALVPCHFLG